MTRNTLSYALVGFIIVGTVLKPNPPKTYPVIHTEAEWARVLDGHRIVQNVIHSSDIPASTAFYCDSVLQAHQNDIYGQVMAAKRAEIDTTGKGKGGKP